MTTRAHLGWLLAACAALFAPLWVPQGAYASQPAVVAPYTAAPPNIDGVVREGEWDSASTLCAFTDIAQQQVSRVQPVVWIVRDEDALYVAARLPVPRGKLPKATTTQRDGQVWSDDALELFLAPGITGSDYYQFIVNAAGAQWDSRGRDGSWDADWSTAAATGQDYWEAELRIPFASLGVMSPADGEVWRLNAAWDRQVPTPLVASWVTVAGTLHAPESFGRLAFAEETAVVQLTGPSDTLGGEVQFEGALKASIPTEAKLSIVRTDGDESVEVAVATAVHAGGDAVSPVELVASLPTEGRFPARGDYEIRLSVTEKDHPVYMHAAPLIVPDPLQVTIGKYFLEGLMEIDATLSGLGIFARGASATANVFNAKGKRLRVKRLKTDPEALTASTVLDVSKLDPGGYELRVAAIGRKGHLLHRVSIPFTKPEIPSWLGSQEGISNEVLTPWTPVTVEGSAVGVWGRNYEFGPLPFPRRVTAAGRSILAGPVTLRVVADDGEYTWQQAGEIETVETTPARTILTTAGVADNIRCSGKVTVEYDGMVRSDFVVTPRGVKTIQQVSLVIPIKEEHAKYLYHFPGRWASAYNAGALPQTGFEASFRPFIWLGDEERGLAWFSESDRNFFVEDPQKVTQITRHDGVVTLQINMVSGARQVKTPLEYTFGFQATPVKPMQPDAWTYRICHQGAYGVEDTVWHGAASITYPAEGNINLQEGTFEAWVRPKFNPQPDIASDDPSRGHLNRNLLDVTIPGDSNIGLYWNIDDRGMRAYYKQGSEYPLILGARVPWKADEWHHVALTWGDKTRIFIDGKKVAERDHKGTIDADVSHATISLGKTPSEFDIDEVRISDIARESFDLSEIRAEDEHTLLLDRMDAIDPHSQERTTASDKGVSGIAEGGTVLPGKWGYAFSLYEPGPATTTLDRLAQLGVRTLVFHEHWTDIQNYTSTTHGEKLHKLVKACHDRGIKLLLYFGYEMSNIAPEWDLYSDECLVYPRRGGYHRQPEQRAYIVCYNSAWQDFMADGIAGMIDEYDIDGVYLDGTANPWACRNIHHGCGYEKPDGSVGETFRIFATREMMRRIYTAVKSRKPDGQVNVHQSTCMTTPTLAFATSYWDGEQFGSIERGPDPLQVLPLDAFRCEFMGRQWGVPAEFLCYERPYTYREAMSFTLLHDVLVRGALGGNLEMESKLWQGMDEFGRGGAVFLPYWDNAPYVETGPDDTVKATIYSRAEDGAVIVVSNLGAEETVAQVMLDLEGLVLSAELTATDMVTGLPVELDADGAMSFPLSSFDFRVIWVKPK